MSPLLVGGVESCSDDSRTHACASHVQQPFPRRLHPTSFTSNVTVLTIRREVIGVACRPARRFRPTYGPWTQARGASRSSGPPESTHSRWTVRAPRAGLGVRRRRAGLRGTGAKPDHRGGDRSGAAGRSGRARQPGGGDCRAQPGYLMTGGWAAVATLHA